MYNLKIWLLIVIDISSDFSTQILNQTHLYLSGPELAKLIEVLS